MKITRLILSGILVWVLIFSLFTMLSLMPFFENKMTLQAVVVMGFIIPFAALGATVYYKSKDKTNGFLIGTLMVLIALILDVFITVPFVETPHNGRGYAEFFADPLLWMLVVENVLVIYTYWKLKVESSVQVDVNH